MATRTLGELVVGVQPDMQRFGPSMKKQGERMGDQAGAAAGTSFAKKMAATVAIGAAAAGALVGRQLVKGLRESVNAARDLNEVSSKIGVVFGKNADIVRTWAKNVALDFGQSQRSALEAAATFAVYGKAARLTGKDLFNFSTHLVSLASDMASFSNSTPEEAIQAIGAALRGEFDPIERYGVLLNETTVKQQALKMGLIDTTKNALTPQQRVLAVQALIFKQTRDAQGDFERTSASLANQQRILTARMENFKATVGTGLLPIVTRFVTQINTKLLPAMEELWAKHGPAIIDVLNDMTTDFGAWAAGLKDIDITAALEKAKRAFKELAPAVKEVREEAGPSFADSMRVFGVVMKFAAQNVDLLAKALPYLAAGLVAAKVAQLGANVAAAISPALRLFELRVMQQQTRAIVANTAARSGETAATVAGSAATTANTAAENLGTIARIRATIAEKAKRVAMIAGTAATWLATAATTALGVAFRFLTGPIGIIITIIGVLTAAVIYAYKHNETFRKIVDNVWRGIQVVIKAVGDWFVNTLWPSIKRAIDQGITAFRTYQSVVRAVWNFVFSSIKFYWGLISNIFNNLKEAVTKGIPNAFTTMVNAVRERWNKLQEVARKPVQFVVNTLINPFIAGINKIAGWLGIKSRVPTINIGSGRSAPVSRVPTSALHSGGAYEGRLPGAPSTRDNLRGIGPRGEPVALASGEFVVNARSTRRHRAMLEAINDSGKFADGGLLDFFKGPAKWISNRLPIGRLRERFGNNGLIQLLAGLGTKVKDWAVDWVKSHIGMTGAGVGAFGNWPSSPSAQRGDSGVWRRIVALIRSTGPISGSFGNGYRHGDPLWHGSGRAVDWMGYNQDSLATFLAARRPLELIHRTRRRDYAYTRGRNVGSFNNALMEAHRNHIHIAYGQGGMFRSYDMGGAWPSGTFGYNGSGQTEHVATGTDMGTVIDLLRVLISAVERVAPGVGRELTGAARGVAMRARTI